MLVIRYSWQKNNGEWNLNDHARLLVERGGEKVTIVSGASHDEGYYQCIVSNLYGKAMSNTSHLQRAMMDSSADKTVFHQTVQIGQPFKILAQPQKSYPKPTFSWDIAASVEDEFPVKLPFDSRIQMDENGK